MNEKWQTFESVASTYDVVRPDYPDAVYDAVEQFADVQTPTALEVGLGSGQATEKMLARGWTVVGVEPGAELSALAAERLGSSGLKVVQSSFEDAALKETFDVVAAATSWHWVDPKVGYEKSANLLGERGVLALWWNAHVTDPENEAWAPIRAVYESVAPQLTSLARLTPDRPEYDPARETADSGYFKEVEDRSFWFSVAYDAEHFVQLTRTYASHRTLDADTRVVLESSLRDVIVKLPGGVVQKPYEAYVVLARRGRRR